MGIDIEYARKPKEIYNLLKRCYGQFLLRGLDDFRRMTQAPSFSHRYIILARVREEVIGCIRIQPLPVQGRYELWDLAVLKKCWGIGIEDQLIDNALKYLRDEGAKFVRGYTLSMEPYVSAYKRAGFRPVRRMLRIIWDLNMALPELPGNEDVVVSSPEPPDIDRLPQSFIESILPYWDWWIRDHGGVERLSDSLKSWFAPSDDLVWLIGKIGDEIVGLTGFHIRENIGRFFGVMVHPEYRLRRVGYTLLKVVLEKAREKGLDTLIVYTMAYLDHLAPGALLYLKSGGSIKAEYIQLEMKSQL